jgi:hypothetical protein
VGEIWGFMAEIGSGKSLGFKFFFISRDFQRFSEISPEYEKVVLLRPNDTFAFFQRFSEIFRDFFLLKQTFRFFTKVKSLKPNGATQLGGHAGFQWSAGGPGLHLFWQGGRSAGWE